MPNLIHYAIPFFIITMILEVLISKKKGTHSYTLIDSVASISMGIGNVILSLFTKALVLFMYTWAYEYRFFEIEMVWWMWLVLLFTEDFCYYWFHRLGHECRFFWASHVIHHSSQKYNLSTALRQTWTGTFSTFMFWMPLAIFGFDPFVIMTQQMISLLYQYWIHTEHIKTLGFLEHVLNTPSHHRVHHGADVKYLDKNYAGIFIIWDKLFGSFQKEEERPNYGLTTNIATYNPLIIGTHDWVYLVKQMKNSPSFWVALTYLIKPPGWSHDGSSQTAKELQALLVKNETLGMTN